jgi:hypothetical protein
VGTGLPPWPFHGYNPGPKEQKVVPSAFITPLERAWEKTRRLLLQPFDAETWIVIGFGAFMAGLAGGGWTGVNWRLRFPPRFDYYVERPFQGFTDVFAGPVWFLFGSGFILKNRLQKHSLSSLFTKKRLACSFMVP